MRVEVVIPTFNNRDQLRSCLTSLEGQSPAPIRVLVCVDGSTDGTIEWLRHARFGFKAVTLTHDDNANRGRAATRNLGIRHVDSECVLLMDSDMSLAQGALREHLTLLDVRDCVSVGSVKYRNAQTNSWARYLDSAGRAGMQPDGDLSPLDFTTANSAIRTEHTLAVGGFDESIQYGEDTEFAMRLATERGLTFVNRLAAVAHTSESKTIDQALAQLDEYARTTLRAIRERYPDGPSPFWVSRFESGGLVGLMLRIAMNPVTDSISRALLGGAPWPIRRQMINYLVLRTVWRGYGEGMAHPRG